MPVTREAVSLSHMPPKGALPHHASPLLPSSPAPPPPPGTEVPDAATHAATTAAQLAHLESLLPRQSPHAAPLLKEADRLDAHDPLKAFRSQMSVPTAIYFCGNSLGPQPRCTPGALRAHLDKWARLAVDGHFAQPDPWVSIEDGVSQQSMPIVGAKFAHEVVVMNSLTVNLHLMLTAFYAPTGVRCKVLIEHHAFSSDDYALQTHLRARGVDPEKAIVRLCPRDGELLLRDDDICGAIRSLAAAGELALVLLPGVQFYTGQVLPMADIAAVCRELAVPFGLDLAHAVGNIPLHLHDWRVDFAVWCNYKYLNSGPGALASLFLHDDYADDTSLNRLAGWWGQNPKSRFRMQPLFEPQRGARGFQISNPPVLAVVPVAQSLRLVAEAGGVPALREKSVVLTAFLERCLCVALPGVVSIVSPTDPQRRGCQLSVQIMAPVIVSDVNARLERLGVVCDVRDPNVLRIAPAPLFNRFREVCLFVWALRHVLVEMDVVAKA